GEVFGVAQFAERLVHATSNSSSTGCGRFSRRPSGSSRRRSWRLSSRHARTEATMADRAVGLLEAIDNPKLLGRGQAASALARGTRLGAGVHLQRVERGTPVGQVREGGHAALVARGALPTPCDATFSRARTSSTFRSLRPASRRRSL